MKKQLTTVAVAALTVLALASCGKTTDVTAAPKATPVSASSSSTSDAGNFPTPDPADLETTPVDDATTEDSVTDSKFGETSYFTQENDNAFEVTVGFGQKAKCGYSVMACDKPETGDRVVTVPVAVKNTGTATIEISSSMFVLEFPDGTRMEAGDGNALDYTPDNQMDYDHKIRPGAMYRSTLTFEAPKTGFTIVMLDSQYGGSDLHLWK